MSLAIGTDDVMATVFTPGTVRARSATCSKNCFDWLSE